jgi:Beta-galactosidase
MMRFSAFACVILYVLTSPGAWAQARAPSTVARGPEHGSQVTSNGDQYGGWNQLQFEATGFFRVTERDGVWWLVTPTGHAFVSKGVNHVNFRADDAPALGYSPYLRAVQKKYGSQDAWAKAVVERLRGWGFNTLGSWSSPSTFDRNMPYTLNLNLATHAGANWQRGAVGDFFSADFEQRMEAACRELCGPRAKDPWLVGYFTDNELRWGADWRGKESLLQEYLRFPENAAGRKAGLEFLRGRYGDIATLNRAWGTNLTRWEELNGREKTRGEAARQDQADWQEAVARRYFATCKDAIRRADPNHLILGCRFAGLAPDPVLRGVRDSVDVVSFNNYGQTAPAETLRSIHRLTGRPIMLTEFSFKAKDSGLPNTRGAARPVATQQDRADGYARYVEGLIDLPFMVGFHWFEHADEPKEGRFDGENSNYGLVTIEDSPWEVLVRRMTEVNAGLEARHARSAKGAEE